jgi:hypothetical protein
MRRFILAATAIVALGAPMAALAFADPPRSHPYSQAGSISGSSQYSPE